MRNTINIIKRFMLPLLLAITIASCKKNDSDNNGSNVFVDYHQTAVTQFIPVAGANIAYRVLGNKSGTPLVMVSALGNSMDDWDPAVTNGLAQQYKVIIF